MLETLWNLKTQGPAICQYYSTSSPRTQQNFYFVAFGGLEKIKAVLALRTSRSPFGHLRRPRPRYLRNKIELLCRWAAASPFPRQYKNMIHSSCGCQRFSWPLMKWPCELFYTCTGTQSIVTFLYCWFNAPWFTLSNIGIAFSPWCFTQHCLSLRLSLFNLSPDFPWIFLPLPFRRGCWPISP